MLNKIRSLYPLVYNRIALWLNSNVTLPEDPNLKLSREPGTGLASLPAIFQIGVLQAFFEDNGISIHPGFNYIGVKVYTIHEHDALPCQVADFETAVIEAAARCDLEIKDELNEIAAGVAGVCC